MNRYGQGGAYRKSAHGTGQCTIALHIARTRADSTARRNKGSVAGQSGNKRHASGHYWAAILDRRGVGQVATNPHWIRGVCERQREVISWARVAHKDVECEEALATLRHKRRGVRPEGCHLPVGVDCACEAVDVALLPIAANTDAVRSA